MNKKLMGMTIAVTALITGIAVFLILTFTGTTQEPKPQTRAPGSIYGSGSTLENAADKVTAERKIIYWKAPMDPTEIYEEPGKSKMGMDLVPVYEDKVPQENKSGDRKIVYWKAPMDPTEIYDEPGKSKMGMDLVPVYEDELVGGVDINIDPVVEQNMGLKTEVVEKGPLNHTIETYGHITFDETRTGVVSQKVSGWIEKLNADYTGFFVKKGDPLYEIYSPDLLSSQEEYLSVFKNYKKNRTNLNQELLASARKRLLYFDISDTEIAAIEKTGIVQKTLIMRSPFQGVITHKNVIEGEFVRSGASLFTISDLSHVWVEAHIFEYEQNLVYLGQSVEMSLSYSPEKIYRGKIAYIFPYLQPKTRDVVLRVSFENKDSELKPDMFARIKIDTGAGKTGMFISSAAIIHSGEKKLVFISKGMGKFTPRQITTGVYLAEGKVQVLTGLKPGETVVVSGQFLLDSESRLKEAIQKMIESKSKPAEKVKESGKGDDFFDDMTPKDDFFKDMK
ncbi:RndB [Desulforapulum autotrophicum HRM2]|uniref:RndB n=1 Tax=Desulforapulum autotrophicum (strain ATCC 43914 / DSM 3382 / VKM B-1955 / HRM2) TaxID=177437 RepID=C0QE52_DESAH|nr:efflux RND transporter periplasmic adaptor subunit [Desulforapulum autotrophicum]ACN13169.1 RndB [Desulforapulum autotrophicum HRM2]